MQVSVKDYPEGDIKNATQNVIDPQSGSYVRSRTMANPSLDLFSIPTTDYSTQSARYVKISPVTASLTPLIWHIEKQSDLIDLRRSFFQWKIRLQTTAPGNIASGENESNDGGITAIVNNMPHSMIKQFVMKCNGTLLTESADMYHYKSYLQTLLNYNRADGESIIATTNGNWRNEIDNPATYSAANVKGPADDGTGEDAAYTALSQNHKDAIQAMKKETRDVWSGGKTKVVRMVPNHELFHQGRYIVPNTTFEFQFWLNSTNVWTNNVTNTGVREPTTDDVEVTFHMCVVKLDSGVYRTLISKLEKEMAHYPIVKSEIRQFPLENGATYKEILNPFNNRVPLRFYIAIVEQTAFNGSLTKDPFAFQAAGIEWIKQIVNGEEYPYETMDLNTGNNYKDDTGYWRFLEATGCMDNMEGNMIRKADWGYGKNATIFAFSNVASGRHSAPVLHPKPQAHIDLHLKCATQTNAKTIIIMAEYETVISIDSPKSVTFMNA